MEIDNFSGTPVPNALQNLDSARRLDSSKFSRGQAGNVSEDQVEAKESASVKVSIANHKLRVNSSNHKVVFDIDPKSKEVVIKLFNEATGKEIRQIPAEDTLRLSQRISEFHEKFLDLG